MCLVTSTLSTCREPKSNLIGLGYNLTDGSVLRIGKSICLTIKMLQSFDKLIGIKEPSKRHSQHSIEKDVNLLLKQLHGNARVLFTSLFP